MNIKVEKRETESHETSVDTKVVADRSGGRAAWIFDVDVEGSKYIVTVPREYWQKLTGGKEEPESLVRRSFEFLLQREPKESILREFELPLIQKYFPEYESKITKSF